MSINNPGYYGALAGMAGSSLGSLTGGGAGQIGGTAGGIGAGLAQQQQQHSGMGPPQQWGHNPHPTIVEYTTAPENNILNLELQQPGEMLDILIKGKKVRVEAEEIVINGINLTEIMLKTMHMSAELAEMKEVLRHLEKTLSTGLPPKRFREIIREMAEGGSNGPEEEGNS